MHACDVVYIHGIGSDDQLIINEFEKHTYDSIVKRAFYLNKNVVPFIYIQIVVTIKHQLKQMSWEIFKYWRCYLDLLK